MLSAPEIQVFMNVVNITTVPKSRNLGFEHLGNMGFVSKSTSPGIENVANIPFVKKKAENSVAILAQAFSALASRTSFSRLARVAITVRRPRYLPR